VASGVTTDNRGSSRTLIEQFIGSLGSSTDRRPIAYNDEVTALRVGYNGLDAMTADLRMNRRHRPL